MPISKDWQAKLVVAATLLILAGYLIARPRTAPDVPPSVPVDVPKTGAGRVSLSPPGNPNQVNLNLASRSELKAVGLDDGQVEQVIRHRPYVSIDAVIQDLGLSGGVADELKQRAYVPKSSPTTTEIDP